MSTVAPLEIALSIDDRVGALAEVAQVLAEAGVNVSGMMLGRHPDNMNLRLVVDNPEAAIAALARRGYNARRSEVLTYWVRNQPGALARAAGRLAQRGINVEAVFLSARSTKRVELVFRVDDVEAARKALRSRREEE